MISQVSTNILASKLDSASYYVPNELGAQGGGVVAMGSSTDKQFVIDASKSKTKNLYFIGPYGSRVSFASQQRRVLNLIWAIRENGDWPKKEQPRAIVVGAGIAGVMAAAALRLQGCSVWLFEKFHAELEIQRDAAHRLVHPTINFWPEQPLSWTTAFPFLDWYAAPCEEIIRTINRQWITNFKPHVANRNFDKDLAAFDQAADGERVELRFKDDANVYSADIVFVTTGFGSEKTLNDPEWRSYWEGDSTDKWARDPKKRFAVSGTGDGGLIDALRLTYEEFMTEEIALKFLLKVDPQPAFGEPLPVDYVSSVRQRVIKIEKDAAAISNLDTRAIFYDKEYTDFALDQDQSAKDLLEWSDKKRPILLIGERVRPYDIGAAPVHKILIALSIAAKRIEYMQGEVSRDATTGVYKIKNSAPDPVVLEADHVIVRHGAVPPIVNLLDPDALAHIIAEQRKLGDFIYLDGFDERKYFDNTNIAPGRTKAAADFRRQRSDLARDFLERRFAVGFREPMNDPFPGFEVIDNRSRDEADQWAFGPIPNSVFGIPLRRSVDTETIVDPLVRPAQ